MNNSRPNYVIQSHLDYVKELVVTRLDYGTATLAGVSGRLLDRLQSVLNAAVDMSTSAIMDWSSSWHLISDLQNLSGTAHS